MSKKERTLKKVSKYFVLKLVQLANHTLLKIRTLDTFSEIAVVTLKFPYHEIITVN